MRFGDSRPENSILPMEEIMSVNIDYGQELPQILLPGDLPGFRMLMREKTALHLPAIMGGVAFKLSSLGHLGARAIKDTFRIKADGPVISWICIRTARKNIRRKLIIVLISKILNT